MVNAVEESVPAMRGRVAMISLHTSPLDQPGTGDAGGMNVYVVELARRLAARNVAVDIYTRATSSSMPAIVEAHPGVAVHNVPGYLIALACGVVVGAFAVMTAKTVWPINTDVATV